MPLTINVGLSRKASKDYQSTGVSINITAELDQALLAKPAELQQQIAGLYQQAETALAKQTAPAPGSPLAGAGTPGGNRPAARPAPGGNGHARPKPRNATPMTAAQRKAISAIGERLGLDLDAECRDILGANLDGLSVREASRFIDHLKSLQTSNGERA